MSCFEALFAAGDFKAAAELAAADGALRTLETVAKFMSAAAPSGGNTHPALLYFDACLKRGRLNAYESCELARIVISQNKPAILRNWLAEDKLECTEALGDVITCLDAALALKVYVKAKASAKVVAAHAACGELGALDIYCKQQGYVPDFSDLMQRTIAANPAAAVDLAAALVAKKPPPLDANALADSFLTSRPPMVHEATQFLLEVLKPNLPEHAALQTKVLEMNLLTFPTVADAILANNRFSHFDKPRIAQLCEKAGLYARALQLFYDNGNKLSDIKRVLVRAATIGSISTVPQSVLVKFFGSLSVEWALECMRALLVADASANRDLCLAVAKEYAEHLSAQGVIELLEEFECWDGLFQYLRPVIAGSKEPEVHFKYIVAAARTGQIAEVERMTRESDCYNPQRAKLFLIEAKLPDARPLINVCDRFDGTAPQNEGMVHDMTLHFLHNSMMRYIEGYVQKVNPRKTPQVVGALLDANADESYIKTLILSVRASLPVGPLVDEVEARGLLKFLRPFLELLIREGSTEKVVHNAMGKVLVDGNTDAQDFLQSNPHYEPRVLGQFCEKRGKVHLACVAYMKGRCDFEYVDVTSRNSLFKQQARYVVERMDAPLWAHVLRADNAHRKQLIDQVASTVLPESKNPEQVSVTVKGFMTAELKIELIKLLEKIVLQNSAFSNNANLQNLLILTAMKSDASRVMDYIPQLDQFDGRLVGELAAGTGLYEEAFAIFRKFQVPEAAMNVLTYNLKDVARAAEYAAAVDSPKIWSLLAGAQLAAGAVGDSAASLLRAQDFSTCTAVCDAAARHVGAAARAHASSLAAYLRMARKKVDDVARVDTELVYCLAVSAASGELNDFLAGSHAANVVAVAQRLLSEGLVDAARVLFEHPRAGPALARAQLRCPLPRELEAATPPAAGRADAPAAPPPAKVSDRVAEEEPAPAAPVPTDVEALLSQLSLSSYGHALVDRLGGVSCVADLRHVTDAMLRAELPAMKPLERAKLLSAVAERAAGIGARPVPPVRLRALVVGVDAYEEPVPGALKNAVADATAVHAALSRLPGAACTLLTNCTKAALEAALVDFRDGTGACKSRGMRVVAKEHAAAGPVGSCAADAGAHTLAVFFFAGHGLQVNGRNYLVPRDFRKPACTEKLESMLRDTARACVALTRVEEVMGDADVHAAAIWLDCCRNVPPFLEELGATRSMGGAGMSAAAAAAMPSGMGQVAPQLANLLITFAAAPGMVAWDNSSRLPAHSPFTAALLAALATPRRLLELAPFLTDEVSADTRGAQRPHVGGSYGIVAGNILLGGLSA